MAGIGIDFGTTNSVAAEYDKLAQKSRPLLDIEGLPHPSIVWYSDEIRVGREAKNSINTYLDVPGNFFIPSIKRQLGSNSEISVFGNQKKPYQIAADIFRHLKKDASQQGVNIEEAVVTVPIYFSGTQRAELRKAASEAGIYIKTFIHEPFAAVIGYIFGKEQRLDAFNGKYILVFDWGGGTLDITLVKVERDKLYEVSTGGISDIAGDKFDSVLKDYAISRFIDRYKLDPNRVDIKPRIKDRLAVEAEMRKIELSSEDETELFIERFIEIDHRFVKLDIKVTRKDFERLIKPDVSLALAEVNRVLEEANIRPEQVSLALLIGGTSKIPLVNEEIMKLFSARTRTVDNSNTIIAEGAAIIAVNNWRPYLARPILVELSDKSYYTVFGEGRPIVPEALNKKVEFYCTDNRTGEATLIVAEHTNLKTNTEVKTKKIINIPLNHNVPDRYLEKIITNFSFDKDLILKVSAHGSVKQEVINESVYDLCYGLQIS